MPAKIWLAVRIRSVSFCLSGMTMPAMIAPVSGCGASTTRSMPVPCTTRIMRPFAWSMAPSRLPAAEIVGWVRARRDLCDGPMDDGASRSDQDE